MHHFHASFFFDIGCIDALVFSGGLGENSSELRQAVVERCACLGFGALSRDKNQTSAEGGPVVEIGNGEGKARILICKTNEEVCRMHNLTLFCDLIFFLPSTHTQLEIARQCIMKPQFWN